VGLLDFAIKCIKSSCEKFLLLIQYVPLIITAINKNNSEYSVGVMHFKFMNSRPKYNISFGEIVVNLIVGPS
jgi:hypothetical protein